MRMAVGLLAVMVLPQSERDLFQARVVHDAVDHPHHRGLLGGVVPAQEEDLPGALLPDHAGQVRAPVAAIEAGYVGVRLFEDGVLATGEGHVADHVETVSTADGPTGHDRDDHLGHEPDEALYFQDVQATEPPRIDRLLGLPLGVLVAVAAPNALVAARAEGPSAILGGGPVAGEQHAAHVAGEARVLEGSEELVDRSWAEGVAHFRPVEGDADGAVLLRAVVGDVLEVGEAGDLLPAGGVENLGDHGARAWHPRRPAPPAVRPCSGCYAAAARTSAILRIGSRDE